MRLKCPNVGLVLPSSFAAAPNPAPYLEIAMKSTIKLTTIIVAALSLFACGGGGSGGGSSPTPLTLVTVTSSNATKLTGAASGAAFGTAEIGGLTDITGATASSQGSLSKQDAAAAATKVAHGTLIQAKNFILAPETSFCLVSGSVTVSVDMVSPLTFTVGDFISIDSDMCDDGEGTIIDGLLEMTISSFDGDILTAEFLFGVDLVLTAFTVIAAEETMTADGDIGTTIDTRTPPIIEGSVFGDSFVVSGMGTTQSISNFSTIYTEDSSTFPVSWTNNSMGVVDSSEFSGAVRYETPITFEGSGLNYPHTGHLLITGADGATLLLRTLNDVDIEIDADYDGDNTIDETFQLTWAELEAQQ